MLGGGTDRAVRTLAGAARPLLLSHRSKTVYQISKTTLYRRISTRDWKKYPFDPSGALDEQGQIPAAPFDLSPLPGTAPEYKTHLILLPKQYPRPDVTWPSHIDSTCPIYSELASRVRTGGSLEGYGLNFATAEMSNTTHLADDMQPWDPYRASTMRMPPNQAAEDEIYTLYAYRTPGLFVAYPEPVSLRTLPSGEKIRNTLEALFQQREARYDNETHIYVCTHGTRDCRCGVVGTEVHDALVRKIREHSASCIAQGSKPAKRVRVFKVSHVGGHKVRCDADSSGPPMRLYTPMEIGMAIFVFPMLRTFRSFNISLLLRAALAPASSRHDLDDLRERLVVWPRWRGRIGMSKLEQQEHMNVWGPPLIHSAQLVPRRRTAPPAGTKTTPKSDFESKKADTPGTPVPLRFHGYDGTWYDVEGFIGESLMETAKRHDLPGIEATCGGELECATCHAYLCGTLPGGDPQARGDLEHEPSEASALFGELSDEEDDMLEYALSRKASSRLTCRIPVSRRISDWTRKGGRIELPRY